MLAESGGLANRNRPEKVRRTSFVLASSGKAKRAILFCHSWMVLLLSLFPFPSRYCAVKMHCMFVPRELNHTVRAVN